MLTKYDELLCHQNATTFDHVGPSDLRWTERVVLFGFDTSGDINVMTGLARYPNRNVIDAYAMVTRGNKTARVVRLSTELRPEDSDLTTSRVGPFSYQVVEALKRVRATLDENEHGLSFQLDFDGTFPAYEQEPAFFRARGRVLEDARRFYQLGKIRGTFTIDGTEYEVDEK